MDPLRDEDSAEAEYERHFDTLSKMAADLGLPSGEAEELITDILLSTLVRRSIPDMDTWLAASLTHAVEERGRGTC